MLILGLNAYHGDSSACMLKDGKIIAAAEEERFRRIKHWAGFPPRRFVGVFRNLMHLAEVDLWQSIVILKHNYLRRLVFLLNNVLT